MSQDEFRIVHLADLHLTRCDTDSRTEFPLLKPFCPPLTGMNDRFKKLVSDPVVQLARLVLVTGDVTDRSDTEAWRLFWDTMKDKGLLDRTLVVPGNHDVCFLGKDKDDERAGYEEEWPDEDLKKMEEGLIIGKKMGCKHQPTSFPAWVRFEDRLAIFCLNSCNVGNRLALYNAVGRLWLDQLESFGKMLWVPRDSLVKIVALHHRPYWPEKDEKKYKPERDDLAESKEEEVRELGAELRIVHRHALRWLCYAHGVRLLLHGHLHEYIEEEVPGLNNKMCFRGAPASTEPVGENDDEVEAYEHTISASGSVSSQRITIKLPKGFG